MATIGAFEAKTHLSRLLEKVAAGEKFVITRHGRPVAKLVPVDSEDEPSRLKRERAIKRLKTVGNGNRLGRLTIRQLVGEGRKY